MPGHLNENIIFCFPLSSFWIVSIPQGEAWGETDINTKQQVALPPLAPQGEDEQPMKPFRSGGKLIGKTRRRLCSPKLRDSTPDTPKAAKANADNRTTIDIERQPCKIRLWIWRKSLQKCWLKWLGWQGEDSMLPWNAVPPGRTTPVRQRADNSLNAPKTSFVRSGVLRYL